MPDSFRIPMIVLHTEALSALIGSTGTSLKFLLNDRALAFFPASQQHRDTKFPSLSYEDDYKGNAMAGIIQNGRAEIRFHQAFTDARVKTIWAQTEKTMPTLASNIQTVTYQGRIIK